MKRDKQYFDERLSKYGLDYQTFESCYKEIHDKVSGELDIDWIDIITKYNLNLSKDTIRKAATQEIFGSVFVNDYFDYKQSLPKTSECLKESNYRAESLINKDGTYTSDKLITVTKDELKDKSSLLKAHGYDPKCWELISAKNSIWNMYNKNDGIKELYSSKIVVKPLSEVTMENVKDFYKELVNCYKPPIVKRYVQKNGNFMAELPIVDLHYGKLSTPDIVSDSYNSNEARLRFNYVIDSFIERFKNVQLEKVIFPIGNDFWHYDTVSATTTGGTAQDTDLKHQTLFQNGVLLLIDAISKISSSLKVPVHAFCVQGNHDFMTSYHGTMALWCYFQNNENVTIDLDTSPRKYIHYGNNLIGFTHGDKEKKRIGTIMQVEAAEAWGQTKYREIHRAHLHSEHLDEVGGIIIRDLPSVTGTDAWHHNSGYVGSIRKCSCFLWNKETGLDSIINIVIE